MFLSYFTLFVALSLSAIAAWYSIVGLTAIFAAAVVPIIIMGGALEVAKVTITIWLHEHWNKARWLMKLYLVPAVVVLMIITSMGIFGFLSKAHLDQTVPTSDVAAQVALTDEKIAIERATIEDARRLLKQLDDAVIGIQSGEGREVRNRDGSTRIENPAERALAVRRSQARDRAALTQTINEAQARIVQLQEESAPVRAQLRAVEAEVGPIKYIAALIYGDNPDANLLERAVRWMIILLVIVFDPLAIMMVLAATESLKWRREAAAAAPAEPPSYPPDDGALTDEQLAEIEAAVNELNQTPEPEFILEQHPYLNKEFVHFKDLKPMVPTAPVEPLVDDESLFDELPTDTVDDPDDDEEPHIKAAMREWKQHNPGKTIKHQRELFEQGRIEQLPWLAYVQAVPDHTAKIYRGTEFPTPVNKGDSFIRTDSRPTRIYKHNGVKWIEVDKTISDLYTYDTAYIDWLIERISAGDYDPDLLTESEQTQITERINQTKGN
jgi:hypothetical protein